MIQTINGAPLALETAGPDDGPAVLLLHSVGLSTRQGWRGQVGVLAAAGFRVVTFDFPGLGESPPGGAKPDVGAFVRTAIAVLDALGIARAHVMGVSLGGFVAQILALDHPARVGRLVLVSTAARIAAGNSGARAARNDAIRARGMAVAAGPQIDSHFPESFRRDNPGVMDWYRGHYLANDPETYIAIMEDLGRFDTTSRLGAIAAPTLVVAGGEDDSNVAGGVPGRAAAALAAAIPGAALVIVEGAHHYPHIDHAETFNERVLAFLRGAPPPRSE
jgi:pimeloyl-ACP methyl ester carboxylesterase